MCIWCNSICETCQLDRGDAAMASMAFATINFSSTPWSWHDVVKRRKHYFFCQVHGSSDWKIDDRAVMVSAGFGVWLPRGTKYSADFGSGDVICALGFEADGHPAAAGAGVIEIDTELEDLLMRFSSPFTFEMDADRARQKIMDVVERIALTPRSLIFPVQGSARRVAEQIIADPALNRTIDDWAAWSHSSARSLQRAFVAETGASFQRWRMTARMEAAHRLLKAGKPIATVARAVGYISPSSFTRAFKAHFGFTPTASLDSAFAKMARASAGVRMKRKYSQTSGRLAGPEQVLLGG